MLQISIETDRDLCTPQDLKDRFIRKAQIIRGVCIFSMFVAASLLLACGGSAGFEYPPSPAAEPVSVLPAPAPEPFPAPDPAPPEEIPLVVADPRRGEQLFTVTPRAGTLICVDCHSENPAVNNFGNIWSGRNAVSLIQRAVSSNTGGMNRFAGIYSTADFADIAAFLGNSPTALVFDATAINLTSSDRVITVSASTKIGMENLSIKLVGDFTMTSTTCASSVPRFSNCTINVAFKPKAQGARKGAVLLNHDGTPAPVIIALSGEGL